MSLLNSKKNKEPKPPKEPKPKKEKKAKAAKAPKEKKVPNSKVKGPKKRAPMDRYTLVLLFCWLAMVAACIMLYLDLNSYK